MKTSVIYLTRSIHKRDLQLIYFHSLQYFLIHRMTTNTKQAEWKRLKDEQEKAIRETKQKIDVL